MVAMSRSVMLQPIKKAGCMLLLSNTAPSTFKVLMTRRNSKVPHLAGAYAFPSSAVITEDAATIVATEVSLFDFRLSAIRALAEQAATALTADGKATPADAHGECLPMVQASRLTPYAHWITPHITYRDAFGCYSVLKPHAYWLSHDEEEFRYDTWFFLHRAQDNAEEQLNLKPGAHADVTDVAWMTPREALEQHASDASTFSMPPLTYLMMHHLATFEDSQAVMDAHERHRCNPQRSLRVVEPMLSYSKSHPPQVGRQFIPRGATHLEKGYFDIPRTSARVLVEEAMGYPSTV